MWVVSLDPISLLLSWTTLKESPPSASHHYLSLIGVWGQVAEDSQWGDWSPVMCPKISIYSIDEVEAESHKVRAWVPDHRMGPQRTLGSVKSESMKLVYQQHL